MLPLPLLPSWPPLTLCLLPRRPCTPAPPPPPPADALGTDFRALHSELLSYGGYRASTARSLAPAQLTPEWLQQQGGFRPVLIPAAPGATGPAAARSLGIALPEGSLTVDRLAARIGLPFEVRCRADAGRGPRR